MKKFLLLVTLNLFINFSYSQSGYSISINLKNCKDTIAFLTYYQFDKTFIKDTCTSIKNGKIVFKGKNKLEKGIYSLVSQEKTIYFDFFVDENTQKLEFANNLSPNSIEGLMVLNSPTEGDFIDYLKFISRQNIEFINYKNSINPSNHKDTLILQVKQQEINKKITEYENVFKDRHHKSYIGDVINLKIDKVLETIPKASNGRPDSLKIYNYYKNHYWDNVDFKDDGLIRNPFFYPKLKKYFESVIVQHPDSLIVEVDRMMGKTQQGSLLNKTLLSHLIYSFETSNRMGFDKIFVYISDNYFKTGKANGIYEQESVLERVIKRADKLKPLLLGSVAPDLYMIKANDYPIVKKMGFEEAKNSEEATKIYYENEKTLKELFYNLNSVSADFLILVFWDFDCGHCQKEIPKLMDLYNKLKKEKKDIKVFSVYTLQEGDKFLKYISENGLTDWINVYDGAHLNNIINKYDVVSTPVIYILDKNKIIKAKKIEVEQIGRVIQEMEKESQKTN